MKKIFKLPKLFKKTSTDDQIKIVRVKTTDYRKRIKPVPHE